MFGDPVENPMGWEVKKLGDICTKISDGVHAKLNILLLVNHSFQLLILILENYCLMIVSMFQKKHMKK